LNFRNDFGAIHENGSERQESNGHDGRNEKNQAEGIAKGLLRFFQTTLSEQERDRGTGTNPDEHPETAAEYENWEDESNGSQTVMADKMTDKD